MLNQSAIKLSLLYLINLICYVNGSTLINEDSIRNFTFQDANFRILLHENDRVLIGARDSLFAVNFEDVTKAKKILEWKSSRYSNYLLYMSKRIEGPNFTDYFICGTYGGMQKCQVFKQYKNRSQLIPTGLLERNGGLVPWRPDISYIHSSKGSKMYIATFRRPDERPRPFLQQFDIEDGSQLNIFTSKQFFMGNDRVKFFKFLSRYQFEYLIFSEVAEEATNKKLIKENINFKEQYTRVLRFCTNDPGLSMNSYAETGWFSTMLKARLLCSQFPTSPDDSSYESYDFNRLLTVSGLPSELMLKQKSGLTDKSDSFIGLFSTNRQSIQGQHQIAFCSFSLEDVDRVFRKGNIFMTKAKTAGKTLTANVTECSNGAKRYRLRYELMNDPIYSINKQPFKFLNLPYLPTSIVIDWNIRFVLGNYSIRHADLAYIGTDDGKVLKMLLQSNQSSEIIDTYQVFNQGTKIHSLLINRTAGQLMVLSDPAMISLPLHRCSHYDSCSMCAETKDLFCIWDFNSRSCVENPQIQSTEYSLFVEDYRDKCLTHYSNTFSEVTTTTATYSVSTKSPSRLSDPISLGSRSNANSVCSSNEFIIYILLIIIGILLILLIAICLFPSKLQSIRTCQYAWPFLAKSRAPNNIILERTNPEVTIRPLRKSNFEPNSPEQIAIRYSHFQESRKAVANVYQEISFIDNAMDDLNKNEALLHECDGIDKQLLIVGCDSYSPKPDSPVYEETESDVFPLTCYKNGGMMNSSIYSHNISST